MIRIMINRSIGMIALCAVLLVSSCSSTSSPASYYTLNAVSDPGRISGKFPANNFITIGVGPVKLPKYLTGSKIVTRMSPNKLKFNEYHRWGGSVEDDVLRIVSKNLHVLTGANIVVTYPWKRRITPDFILTFNLQEFEAIPGKSVTLKAVWGISEKGKKVIRMGATTNLTKQLKPTDIEAIVSAKSKLLAELCQIIGDTLMKQYLKDKRI